MTSKLIEAFPCRGGKFQIEPDASSGSYFWAAGECVPSGELEQTRKALPDGSVVFTRSMSGTYSLKVSKWPHASGWQIDARFPEYVGLMTQMSLVTPEEKVAIEHRLEKLWGPMWRERLAQESERNQQAFDAEHGPVQVSRQRDLGDSIMTLIAIAPLASQKIVFADLGRLRVQETERVVALRTELTRCGAKVVEEGNSLTVHPSKLHGAEIETYNDHRMAMCFAILGLKVPGIKLKNTACVKKTFPNFFQKLAAKSPAGLGAVIRDAKTGKQLTHDELFAD